MSHSTERRRRRNLVYYTSTSTHMRIVCMLVTSNLNRKLSPRRTVFPDLRIALRTSHLTLTSYGIIGACILIPDYGYSLYGPFPNNSPHQFPGLRSTHVLDLQCVYVGSRLNHRHDSSQHGGHLITKPPRPIPDAPTLTRSVTDQIQIRPP
jgi:hypothetical protein